MGISSTSWMFAPRYRTSSVSPLNRRPSHALARDGHRPEELHADLPDARALAGVAAAAVTLNEKRPLPKPRLRASGSAANRSRT